MRSKMASKSGRTAGLLAISVITTVSFLTQEACALLPRDTTIRQYIRNAKQRKLTSYEQSLFRVLGAMESDVIAQTQPVLRVSSSDKNKTFAMHPITFSIPAKHVHDTVQPKARALGTVVPGDWSTYAFLPRKGHTPQQLAQLERDYYVDMQRSFFGLTWKKAGWDCLRHLELLASGCLPLFTDIADAPRGVLALYPKRVLKLLLEFPGIRKLSGVPGRPSSSSSPTDQREVEINEEEINLPLYAIAVNALLEFTRNRLTTEAVAAHVLRRMGVPITRPKLWYDAEGDSSCCLPGRRRKRRSSYADAGSFASAFRARRGSLLSAAVAIELSTNQAGSSETKSRLLYPACSPPTPIRILFLSLERDEVDYMTDTLLHGFKALLGDANVVDYHRRSVLYNTPETLFERDWAPKRSKQYGSGFSYGKSMLFAMDLSDGDGEVEQDHFEELLRVDIAGHAFDAIIFGLVHRGEPPLLKEVCSAYPRERVAAVHGHDRPPSDDELARYDACAKYQFVREAY